MSRKVLLIESDYKNKYPPMGLMKLATYYRNQGDDVRFFKGNLKNFAAQLLCEEFLAEIQNTSLGKYVPKIIEYIKTGKNVPLDAIPHFESYNQNITLEKYRIRYKEELFPKFDIIAITTLFTFYWKKTINTINYSKKFINETGEIFIGGIAASILHGKIYQETGIVPICGLLNKPEILDKNSVDIIDELPLDYSILEEIDYKYPANNAYLSYMTRGCPRKCAFCAVPRLEPVYKDFISIKDQIQLTSNRFGQKKALLLMDNNVFASKYFNNIIDEIKECGFSRGSKFTPDSEYDIAYNNLIEGYNIRAYTKKMISLYDCISDKLPENEQADFYLEREKRGLLYAEVANVNEIINFNKIVYPLYEKHFRRIKRIHTIDFNQGVDARLVTEEKIKKLAELNIHPLRIAFDHYSMKDTYISAIRLVAKYGIKDLSNYILYNFNDKPDDLYYRLKINVDLCEELGVTIYSFPMKYHPIDDPDFFHNRDYIGKYWNKKFIRSIQSVLNSTKGKIGRSKSFFEEAFGSDIDGFYKILWMPEKFIINRFKYKNNLTYEWWTKYNNLDSNQLEKLQSIVALNHFKETDIITGDVAVDDVLSYYK